MVRGEVQVYYPSNWFYLAGVFMIAMGGYFIFAGKGIYRDAADINDKIPAALLILFGIFFVVASLWMIWQLAQKNRWIEVHHDHLEVQQPAFFSMRHLSWTWDEIAAIDITGQAGFMVLHKPPVKKKIMLKGYPRELLFEIVRRTPGIKIHFDVYKKIRKLAEAADYAFTEESFL